MNDKEEKWQKLVNSAFEAAKLPEVTEDQLETGTYTNAQIAEKMRDKPVKFLSLLMDISQMGGGNASRRSILSFAVDMVDEEEQVPPPA